MFHILLHLKWQIKHFPAPTGDPQEPIPNGPALLIPKAMLRLMSHQLVDYNSFRMFRWLIRNDTIANPPNVFWWKTRDMGPF